MTTTTFIPGGTINSSSGNPLLLDSTTGSIGLFTTNPTGSIGIGGTSARTLLVERNTSGSGNNLTIKSGGSASGSTNANAGDLILTPGTTTGTGRSKIRILNTSIGSPGTSDNAVVDRWVNGSITMTNTSTISIADVLINTNGQAAGGAIMYSIQAVDGTNSQTESGTVTYTGALAGGVYSTQIVRSPGAGITTAGTLSTLWSISTTPATKMTIQATSTSTGLSSPVITMYYTFQNNSNITTNLL
jgi:hypothetical protein